MDYKDYYQTLGIERGASDDDIKTAYRRLARKYHPDVSKEPEAEVRFKEMKEAYEVLKDPQKRAAYDQFGASGQDFRPPPGFGQRPRGPGGFDHGHSDFFEALFGRGGGFEQHFDPGGFGQRARPRKGADVNATIRVSLEEAFTGAKRQIRLDGAPGAKERVLSVRVPKGITEGKRIRLEKQGSAGTGAGAPAGDLYLEVTFLPHPMFTADGSDIHLILPIAPWEAALGATIKTPTLAGDVDLKIPAGSNSGNRMRLRGRGLPGKTTGDQYVELKIVTPTELSDDERVLYEQLQASATSDPRASLRSS
ncbi:MAG: DnaJ C-terminal domain-containing protein [Gammaproteobacteria bacterium]